MNLMPMVKALEPITTRVRTDITALKKDGKMIWTKDSLTPARLVRHLKSEAARGVCPIKAGENTTKVAVLDFDSHGGETSQGDMMEAARTVRDQLQLEGLYAIPFRSSGGRGIHLYFLWNDEQDAYSVRQVLGRALIDCGFKNGAGGVAAKQIEIFPKQDAVPIDGNGSQFILPLTGKSEPLDIDMGIELGREAVLSMEWPISHPVGLIERPAPVVRGEAVTGDLAKMAGFVMALDPDMGYDEWLRVGMAIHQGTAGGDEGFALWDDWSSESSKYPGVDALTAKWATFNEDREGGVTANTLEMMARGIGYNADVLDDFEIIENENGALEPREQNDAGQNTAPKPEAGIPAAVGSARVALPRFEYSKQGEIIANVNNLKKAIERPDLCGMVIKLDNFREEIMYQSGDNQWRQFGDVDYTRLRLKLESSGFKPIGREMMRDMVAEVADANRFDSAIYWLESLPAWDGVPRIDGYMAGYMGAVDTPYTRAVGRYLWTGLAGRVLDPGCKADMVPILEGKQGIRKSSAVAAMVPAPELFCEISFGEKDDDLARKMRGRLIGEIGELRGLHSRELETIKAFITRTHEHWVPKFREFAISFPRRLMMVGTTNQTEFLADDSGNRRWLPVHVEWCDVDRIKADRLQLWAEARAVFKATGIAYQGLDVLALDAHAQYMMHDGWQDIIEKWLWEKDLDETCPGDADYLIITDVMRDALLIDGKNLRRADEIRIGKILRVLGYEKAVRRVDGKNKKVWAGGATHLV